MLKALREGDECTVVRIDRLARNTKDLLTIVDQIAAAGASLNILDLGIKTDTPIGKMIITVLGSVAELERSYINDRTRKGVEAYIEKGGKMGPKPNAKRDKKIKALAAGGLHSWAEIAEDVGCSKQTVYRVLRPKKAEKHRVADMTRYYKRAGKVPGEEKTPTSANPPRRGTTTMEVSEGRATKPSPGEIILPQGTIFPTTHIQSLIQYARKGGKHITKIMFDGATLENPYEVSGVIGIGSGGEYLLPALLQVLDKTANWKIRMAYFPIKSKKETPDVELDIEMRADGIVSSILQEFGGYSIEARLNQINFLGRADC